MRIIIEMRRGLVEAVYVPDPEAHDVLLVDWDCEPEGSEVAGPVIVKRLSELPEHTAHAVAEYLA